MSGIRSYGTKPSRGVNKLPANFQPLTQENLEIYIQGGQAYKWHLSTEPSIDLVVDIPRKSLKISGAHDGTNIDTDRMRHCSFRVNVAPDGQALFELTISPVEDWYTYYSFIEMVVKRLVEGQPQARAVAESIDIWNSLVSTKPALGQDQEVGLIGELLFLEFLLSHNGPMSLNNWTGPEREEHDFKFGDYDVEVKTTTQEARSHVIGSISQLKESPNKELFLLSNQLTKTGASGVTLSEIVDRINSTLTFEASTIFRDKLKKSKYLFEDAPLYKMTWEVRTSPAFFFVDESFPRLLNSNLGLTPENLGRVSDVSYRINLEGIEPSYRIFPEYEIANLRTNERH